MLEHPWWNSDGEHRPADRKAVPGSANQFGKAAKCFWSSLKSFQTACLNYDMAFGLVKRPASLVGPAEQPSNKMQSAYKCTKLQAMAPSLCLIARLALLKHFRFSGEFRIGVCIQPNSVWHTGFLRLANCSASALIWKVNHMDIQNNPLSWKKSFLGKVFAKSLSSPLV